MTNYDTWIESYRARVVDTAAKCAEATAEMLTAFPELRRVRGYVLTAAGYDRPHWWLTTVDGTIVDPTADQFADYGGALDYKEHVGPEPSGKCPNCGGFVYDGGTVCSDACANAYTAYLMTGC